MKKIIPFALMSSLLMLVSSCAAIEGIFKAGVWSGILLVVVVVAIVIWLISKLVGGSK
jgi:cytosine/uracil/thiamine/allantoin permease